jgi:hypothetical protein
MKVQFKKLEYFGKRCFKKPPQNSRPKVALILRMRFSLRFYKSYPVGAIATLDPLNQI